MLFVDCADGGVVSWSDAADDFDRDLAAHSPTLVVARVRGPERSLGSSSPAKLRARRCLKVDAIRMAAITRSDGHDLNMDWVYQGRNIEVVEAEAVGLGVADE